MNEGKKVNVVRNTRVYDKTRPEGQQEVAFLFAHGEHIYFATQQAQMPEGGTCGILGKQHAIEFASSLLMMALGLPGIVADADMEFGDDLFAKDGES